MTPGFPTTKQVSLVDLTVEEFEKINEKGLMCSPFYGAKISFASPKGIPYELEVISISGPGILTPQIKIGTNRTNLVGESEKQRLRELKKISKDLREFTEGELNIDYIFGLVYNSTENPFKFPEIPMISDKDVFTTIYLAPDMYLWGNRENHNVALKNDKSRTWTRLFRQYNEMGWRRIKSREKWPGKFYQLANDQFCELETDGAYFRVNDILKFLEDKGMNDINVKYFSFTTYERQIKQLNAPSKKLVHPATGESLN